SQFSIITEYFIVVVPAVEQGCQLFQVVADLMWLMAVCSTHQNFWIGSQFSQNFSFSIQLESGRQSTRCRSVKIHACRGRFFSHTADSGMRILDVIYSVVFALRHR